jgi:di/tricarboxylate transporter
VQYHFLAALIALVFATLVHAIVLTYFMGTGRWIEETSNAYRLGSGFHSQSTKIKYRTIPLLVLCFTMLVITGAFGAAADPASPIQSKGIAGVAASTIHLVFAITTLALNFLVNWLEFRALERNGEIVDQVLAEVRRIRLEKGLAVEG